MKTFKRSLVAVLAGIAFAQGVAPAAADNFDSPEILVLGDSQLPFGSGPAFVEFFSDLAASCDATAAQAVELKKLGESRVAAIGVRSTSLPTWLTRSRKGKSALCNVDPKWKVNAGAFGLINTTENKYVQIGRGDAYQFCEPNQSAFETMFRADYYTPKLTLMTFLGNSTTRWANSVDAAIEDVDKLNAQLPDGMGCIFMTTQPAYKPKIVERRKRAQDHLELAFEVTGSQCSFVSGATEATIASHQGNASFFRRRANGTVKDPFHPNLKAAMAFFDLERDAICSAVLEQTLRIPAMEEMTAQVLP